MAIEYAHDQYDETVTYNAGKGRSFLFYITFMDKVPDLEVIRWLVASYITSYPNVEMDPSQEAVG
jgi:hypothetical protein